MARKSGFVRRDNQMKRATFWVGGAIGSFNPTAASTALLTHSANAALLAVRPFTIVRTRGQFMARSDQFAASEDYSVNLGMCVVTDQARAIGVTAVPTPATDSGSDLFYVYESIVSRILFGTGVGFEDPSGRLIQFDSKAMRKVNEDEDPITVIETTSISSGLVAQIQFRQLIKLH